METESDIELNPLAAESDKLEKTEQPVTAHEIGGPKGKEPTRYGDWEKNGRCIDF